MNALTITLGTIAALISLVCWASFGSGVWRIVKTISLGQPDRTRNGPFVPRLKQMLVEFIAHTKMVKYRSVGVFHWLVMVGFLGGALLWFEAYGEIFSPSFHWPIFGGWNIWMLWSELLGLGTVIGISVLMIIRQLNHPRVPSRLSRFSGSDFKAAYFVQWVVLIEGLGMLFVKTFKIASGIENPPIWTSFFTHYFAMLFDGIPQMSVTYAALVKLLSGMLWLAVVGRYVTWGVAWHRFSAFFNIYFKREDDGGPALGAVKPMMSGGKILDMEEADPDVDAFGAGKVEDFSWKGWLDFTTCTECGRCQNQCPAWNTGKPLSPKLMIMSLRDHGFAKAPYLLAGGRKDTEGNEVGLVDADGNVDQDKLDAIPEAARLEADRPLVGDLVEGQLAPVFDAEALWACTNCGACVEQCPVDIEHVDHIIDMRRYQVLIESEFPSELAGLFKNLENKGNPWGQNSQDRMNWISEMNFDIPVFGKDVDSFDDFEYLFWVGCAGAYEDRAKRTTKAVAELLNIAAVNFMVLGDGETCNGDPARRAGNEFLFQQLAMQNVETLNGLFDGVEKKKRKVVATCAHCFNTLTNEYPEIGGNYEVVHHTQLLNRLVRDKRLVPVASQEKEDVTYHDPCFLGRHNKVYEAPRDLIGSNANLVEMERHAERSLCCGAGGARMWMEEQIGKRINVERVDEALITKPKKIVTACPFCSVMMSDGVTTRQDEAAGVEVVDVAQVLLEGVQRGLAQLEVSSPVREKVAVAAPAAAAPAAAPAETAPTASAPAAAPAPAATAPKPPTKGLGMAGGMKPPGKGLGMAGGAKPPGAKAAPAAEAPAAEAPATEAPATEAPATKAPATKAPKPAAKGLGMAGGMKAPGAKRPGAPKAAAAPATPAVETPAVETPAAETPDSDAPAAESPATPKPPVKGLGMAGGLGAPGAKRPGAPKAAAPEAEAPKAEAPKAEAPQSADAPAAETPVTEVPAAAAPEADTPAAEKPAVPSVKPKGLGMAGGLGAPGAKKPGAPKAAAPKAEASEAETPKAEAPKAAPPEAEAPKDAATQAAPPEAVEEEQETPADDKPAEESAAPTPSVKPKGLGMKGGLKPPGKK